VKPLYRKRVGIEKKMGEQPYSTSVKQGKWGSTWILALRGGGWCGYTVLQTV
jgi:hypothetical protein